MAADINDYLEFCDKDSFRFDLSTPFVVGGYEMVTNGSILVRVPTDKPDTTNRDLPKSQSMPWHYFECEWQDGPPHIDVESFQNEPCKYCDGTGEIHEDDCLDCDGTGQVECYECGHWSDCERCDGDGVIKGITSKICDDCVGTKLSNRSRNFRLADRLISKAIKHYVHEHLTVMVLDDGAEAAIAIGTKTELPQPVRGT